jgi:RNA polymerase sigma factor (sigma-70 family)
VAGHCFGAAALSVWLHQSAVEPAHSKVPSGPRHAVSVPSILKQALKESFRIPPPGGSFPDEMSEHRTDFELLAAYGRNSDEGAFRQLVRRHIDLVHATALRKVTDAPAAEEISQNVFHALARKAARFAPDDSLPAWLHRTTLLEARHWLRGELRRRRREETAAQLGTTMNAPEESPAWRELVPLLDDALLSLREKDRDHQQLTTASSTINSLCYLRLVGS